MVKGPFSLLYFSCILWWRENPVRDVGLCVWSPNRALLLQSCGLESFEPASALSLLVEQVDDKPTSFQLT